MPRRRERFALILLLFIASIVFAVYGHFTNKNSFIQLGVMCLAMVGWSILSPFIPNLFPSRIGRWMFQFILFAAIMTFIRSKMSN